MIHRTEQHCWSIRKRKRNGRKREGKKREQKQIHRTTVAVYIELRYTRAHRMRSARTSTAKFFSFCNLENILLRGYDCNNRDVFSFSRCVSRFFSLIFSSFSFGKPKRFLVQHCVTRNLINCRYCCPICYFRMLRTRQIETSRQRQIPTNGRRGEMWGAQRRVLQITWLTVVSIELKIPATVLYRFGPVDANAAPYVEWLLIGEKSQAASFSLLNKSQSPSRRDVSALRIICSGERQENLVSKGVPEPERSDI